MSRLQRTMDQYSIVLQLYKKILPEQLLANLTGSLCPITETLIVDRIMGEAALSQLQVVNAVNKLALIFNLLIASSEILLIGRAICKGDKKAADRYFTGAIMLSVLFGAFACLCCFGFAEPICTFFGADAQMLAPSCRVLKGYALYYVALPLCSALLSLFQIHSDMKTPAVASVMMFVLNLVITYLFLAVFKWDIFYASFSSALAQLAVLGYLVIRQYKNHQTRLDFFGIRPRILGELLSAGLTDAAPNIFSCFKYSLIVKLAALFGGAVALSQFSVVCAVDSLIPGLFPPTLAMTSLMIASIFVGEGDRDTLRRFVKISGVIVLVISVLLVTIMFLLAGPVAQLYHLSDGASYAKVQRIFFSAHICYEFTNLYLTLFAALDKKRLVSVLSAFTSFLLPLSAMLIGGKLFGIYGFWHGLAVGEIISIIGELIYSCIHNRHFPRSVDELLCLDRDFGAAREDTFSLTIRNAAEAVNASEKIMAFCRERGLDNRVACFSGLCLEEIAVNIMERSGKNPTVELVVVSRPESVRLIVRDNCKAFDPCEKLDAFDPNDPLKGVGIRIVMGMAQTEYKNMYGLNILTMDMKKQKAA